MKGVVAVDMEVILRIFSPIASLVLSAILVWITARYVRLVKEELDILQWDNKSKLYSRIIQDDFISIMPILVSWYINMSEDMYRFNIKTMRSELLEDVRRTFLEHVSLKKIFPGIYVQLTNIHQKLDNLVNSVNDFASQITTNSHLINKVRNLLEEYKSQNPKEAKNIGNIEKGFPKYLVGYVFNKRVDEGAALSPFFKNIVRRYSVLLELIKSLTKNTMPFKG